MVGGARRLVKTGWAAAALLLLASGCFWWSFEARLATHTELLRDMAHKGADVAQAGRFTAGVLSELLYPLSRARTFAAEARRRVGDDPPPAALAPFEELLDAYAALCDAIDRARRDHRGPVPAPVLAPALARVDRDAAAVQKILGTS